MIRTELKHHKLALRIQMYGRNRNRAVIIPTRPVLSEMLRINEEKLPHLAQICTNVCVLCVDVWFVLLRVVWYIYNIKEYSSPQKRFISLCYENPHIIPLPFGTKSSIDINITFKSRFCFFIYLYNC